MIRSIGSSSGAVGADRSMRTQEVGWQEGPAAGIARSGGRCVVKNSTLGRHGRWIGGARGVGMDCALPVAWLQRADLKI